MKRGLPTVVVGSALALASLMTTPALAVFSYSTQTRWPNAELYGFLMPPPQTFSATGFGSFDATAALDGDGGNGSAHQRQYSSLTSNQITIGGSYSGFAPAFGGTGKSYGRTLADIAFSVASATDVTLAVTAATQDYLSDPQPRTVSLSGPGTNLSWNINSYNGGWTGSRSQNMTLGAGVYDLRVELYSTVYSTNYGSQPFAKISSFQATFTGAPAAPEPGSMALLAIAGLVALSRRARH